jgi:hypothetical protein
MEVEVSAGGHDEISRLQRPPFALDQPDPRVVDRVAEDGSRQSRFTVSEGPLVHDS